MKCPVCESGKLSKGSDDLVCVVSGITFTAKAPAMLCDACNESIMEGEDLQRFEHGVARQLIDLGVHTGEAFRFVRKVQGLSAVALAELLDVTPSTLSRWENGEPDANAFALLGGLFTDSVWGRTDTRDHLRALRSKERKPKAVKVEVAVSVEAAV
jgi:putative zinc finger/helix-turn-helix YgiT family protein